MIENKNLKLEKFFVVVALVSSCLLQNRVHAQDAIVQEGEFGIGVGVAHYFGDLNTRAHFNRPKMATTVFFRKNFSNYIYFCKLFFPAITIHS